MKKLFTLIVALWASALAVTLSAQTTQLATLLHQGEVSVFYGATALKDAHRAAADGDVITLSAGQFEAADISKALIIRGAGMDLEGFASSNMPTVIQGTVENSSSSLKLEGLEFASDFSFGSQPAQISAERCKFYQFTSNSSSSIILVNCVGIFDVKNAQCDAINCVFYGRPNNYSENYSSFQNCIFINKSTSSYVTYIPGGTYTNCIFESNSSIWKVSNSTTRTFNCIFCGTNKNSGFGDAHSTDTVLNTITSVFKEGTFYELMDEYKNIPGADGKQTGIYGGNIGFSQTPNIPQINRFQVSPRTSADGKLSVEIEVQGIE